MTRNPQMRYQAEARVESLNLLVYNARPSPSNHSEQHLEELVVSQLLGLLLARGFCTGFICSQLHGLGFSLL